MWAIISHHPSLWAIISHHPSFNFDRNDTNTINHFFFQIKILPLIVTWLLIATPFFTTINKTVGANCHRFSRGITNRISLITTKSWRFVLVHSIIVFSSTQGPTKKKKSNFKKCVLKYIMENNNYFKGVATSTRKIIPNNFK